MIALLAYFRAVAGDKTECLRLIEELRGVPEVLPMSFALLYLGAGDKDHAFEQLQKGVDQHSTFVDHLKVQPLFDGLHGDPRYIALLRQMNLN